MSLALRIILFIGAILMMRYVIKSIRKSKIQLKDAFTWLVIAALILLFGIFPQIPIWLAGVVGIESPTNMVFLLFIAILLLCVFNLSVRNSILEDKCITLADELAIRTKKDEENEEQ